MLLILLAVPTAFADSYNIYNYNESDPTNDIANQTIVGEGSNNNVVVTNEASNPPSATGLASAYAPVLGVAVLSSVLRVLWRLTCVVVPRLGGE